MKKTIVFAMIAIMLAGCARQEKKVAERALEVCSVMPTDDRLYDAGVSNNLTPEWYAVLDTLYNLPEHEAMDHEWNHYFCAANGFSISLCNPRVEDVEMKDATHAIVTLSAEVLWDDETEEDDVIIEREKHRVYLERVKGTWLMSDFDEHKADCLRHIAINRNEQRLRNGISLYLVDSIGSQYAQGDLCVPVLLIIGEDEINPDEVSDAKQIAVYGDFWVFNYLLSGDTLLTVSGGNHPGKLLLNETPEGWVVTDFEQVEDGSGNEPSAKRIFGRRYGVYHNMHSNQTVMETAWKEQLLEYINRKNLHIKYVQDYGWPAVRL